MSTDAAARDDRRAIDVADLNAIQGTAVVLALATGAIHLYVGATEVRLPLVLAGVGFVVAVGLFLANYRRRVLYVTGIGYTAVQVVAWIVVRAGEYTPIGYADKAIQLALVAVLAVLWLRSDGT